MKATATARQEGRRDVALRPYLPAPLVNHCLRAPDGPPIWSEWLDGSLMHCDITGFTAMSEALAGLGKEGAELMTGVLNRFFEAMLQIGEPWGGDQLKFGGDAMLLLFAGPDHAARAAACGIAMQAQMREFRRVLAGGQQHELRMRVGIHSDRFFSASVGDPERALHYIVAGPAANRTAQVEATATPGQVAVSRETAVLLGPNAVVSPAAGDVVRVRRIVSPPFARPPIPYSRNANRLLARYLMTPLADLLLRGRGEWLAAEHRRVTPVFIGLLGTAALLESKGEKETVRQLGCLCADRN